MVCTRPQFLRFPWAHSQQHARLHSNRLFSFQLAPSRSVQIGVINSRYSMINMEHIGFD